MTAIPQIHTASVEEIEATNSPAHKRIEQLERENAELRQCAAKLAVFAMAYRSHPKRNPEDELDSSLAQFEALIR